MPELDIPNPSGPTRISSIPRLSEAQAHAYLAYAKTQLVSGNIEGTASVLKFLTRAPGTPTYIVNQAIELLASLSRHDSITEPADATALSRIPRLTMQSASAYLDYSHERINAGKVMEAAPILRLLAQSFGVPADIRETALEIYKREFEKKSPVNRGRATARRSGRDRPDILDQPESGGDIDAMDDDHERTDSFTLGAYLSHDSFRTINMDLEGDTASDSLGFDQDSTLSAFMPFGTRSSAYGKFTLSSSVESVDNELDGTVFVSNRGDTWLSHTFPDGSTIEDIKVGRQYIGESRGWWWDESLDLLLLNGSREPWSFTLGVGQELASDELGDPVEATELDILRVLAEAGTEWRSGHTLSLFLLRHDDRSSQPAIGTSISDDEVDAYDDRLLWIGARVAGSGLAPHIGSISYWLDGAWVSGRDRFFDLEFSDEETDDHDQTVSDTEDIDVNG